MWDSLHARRNAIHKNGIACPACGSELHDSDPYVTLASNPPQKNVSCEQCGYQGYRLA
jgi:DNA-directed RNA polymerase subunit RPC12/RpoP